MDPLYTSQGSMNWRSQYL